MRDFANRLKHARMMKGLTQRQVAESIGLDQSSIHRWEHGKTTPNVEAIKKLIDLYDCSADYLFGLTDIRRRRI